MQQAVLQHYPHAWATYKFKNRGTQRFSTTFLNQLKRYVEVEFPKLILQPDEASYLELTGYFKPWYIEYLKNYRFNPKEVSLSLDEENNLCSDIYGPWHSTILWEVPLMAAISELHFQINYSGQKDDFGEYVKKTCKKRDTLFFNLCTFSEFGTRRRHSYKTQKTAIDASKGLNFKGTSNVHFAKMFNVKPIGTMAHEWIMGVSALEGLEHANRFALDKWVDVYNGNLGIALTDTYGTDAFLKDFDMRLSKLYDGVRQDSGDPIVFTDKIVDHYNKMGINPSHKFIVFSDALKSCKQILNIKNHCDKNNIGCTFGIGTWLTCDLDNHQISPLNMVIKLDSINGKSVVKLSDDVGKVTGDPDAVRIAEHTFFGKDLD